MTVNAFHPDYMKTHEPNFWGTAVADAKRSKTMSNIVSATRQKNPSHGTMIGISNKTPHVSLKPLDFIVYSRAGVGNVAPKRKKVAHEKEELSSEVLASKPKAKRGKARGKA